MTAAKCNCTRQTSNGVPPGDCNLLDHRVEAKRAVSAPPVPPVVLEERRADAAYNHPAHYGGDTTYEAIKVILAWGLSFCLGNTVKYICRAGRKGDGMAKRIEDLRKARWYLDYEIRMLEAEHHEN